MSTARVVMTLTTALAALAALAALTGCGPATSRTGSLPSEETTERGGYALVFINRGTELSPTLGVRLIETFFAVYPPMVEQYNPAAPTKVTFLIDPDYQGVASTDAGVVRFSPSWFAAHPKDVDVVTHEVMHIVQSYPPDSGPGWITEGIADYVRYQLGIGNDAAGWSLPALAPEHHYTTSYRVTARFLVWLEAKIKPGLVKALDAAMRGRTFSPAFWTQMTSKTVDELWAQYVSDPAIPAR